MPAARRDEATAGYFDFLAQGRLAALRCADCGRWNPPGGFFANPILRCPACAGRHLQWTPTTGRGRLITWTYDPTFPSVLDGRPGQAAGLIELDEGPWVYAALDLQPGHIVPGLDVVVDAVIPPGGEEPIPIFRAATGLA